MTKSETLHEMQEELLRRVFDETRLFVSENGSAHERLRVLRDASMVFSAAGIKNNRQSPAIVETRTVNEGDRTNILYALGISHMCKTSDRISMGETVIRTNSAFDTPLPMTEINRIIERCYQDWLTNDIYV